MAIKINCYPLQLMFFAGFKNKYIDEEKNKLTTEKNL